MSALRLVAAAVFMWGHCSAATATEKFKDCYAFIASHQTAASVFGHRAYSDGPDLVLFVRPTDRLTGPQRNRIGRLEVRAPCMVDRSVVPHLTALLNEARRNNPQLYPHSCTRYEADQNLLFCSNALSQDEASWLERALQSAPAGYSEHHTGFAIDFGDLSYSPDCQVEECLEGTLGSRWLQDNATRFGFERSFTENNDFCFPRTDNGREQCVIAEPWHWRFVGPVGADGHVANRLFDGADHASPARPSPRRSTAN
jgi:D-alanyl-D-alanine carboxypeptidase